MRTATAKAMDPAEEAARMGMYGPMTRSTSTFYPTRLLCKRFNVKPPAHVQSDGQKQGGGGAVGATERRSDPVSQASIDAILKGSRFASGGVEGGTETAQHQHVNGSNSVAAEDMTDVLPAAAAAVEIDPERNDALEARRAGQEVFKAIFGDSDEQE